MCLKWDKLALQSAKVDNIFQLENVTLAVQLGGVLKQIFPFQQAEFKEFWQVEDVNLTERPEGVLKDTKWLTISITICLDGQIFTVERCDFSSAIGRCLKTNFCFSISWVQGILTGGGWEFDRKTRRCLKGQKVVDNQLYNLLRWTNCYSWKM